jgi:hypothetical protein
VIGLQFITSNLLPNLKDVIKLICSFVRKNIISQKFIENHAKRINKKLIEENAGFKVIKR